MDLGLSGKTVVITGASKGIGLAMADAFAAEGADVIAAARHESAELRELAARLRAEFVSADLSTPAGAELLIEKASTTRPQIDVLINNVGASVPAADALDFSDEVWHQVLDVTFFSAVRATRAARAHLRPGAAVLNVGSLNARLPAGMLAPYSAAKAALINFSKALAEDLGPNGVRVNSLSSGPVRTPMWTAPGAFAELMGAQAGVGPAELMDRVLPESMSITLGRVAEPAEIADLALFLCSARAAYITGADYVIDGGMFKSAF